ncbi:MAG: sodium ion-translocating decarboxylase subunit beta [Lachnospiraceae bacterium]|nr:sodium ion-translocating decarboxylase subunit beta [Lachnospiraceae bacterium]
MKKVLTGVLAAVGAVIFCVGVTSMTKKAAAITIIGGADGPTSVFLAGKVGDGFWWLLTVVGGLIIGLSVALFALLVRKKQ